MTALCALTSVPVQRQRVLQSPSLQWLTGTYVNADYFYSVEIPKGLRAFTPAPPEAQHGFDLPFDGTSDSVTVFAHWNTLLLSSVDSVADDQIKSLKESHGVDVVSRTATRLADLEAREMILRNPRSAEGATHVRCTVALRNQERGVGIVYLIMLVQREKNPSGEALYSAVVSSFRLRKAEQLRD